MEGVVGEVAAVRGRLGIGQGHAGHLGPRPGSKVTGSGPSWGRPVGASCRAACWTLVYIPDLGCFAPWGGKLKVVACQKGQLRISGCGHSLSYLISPERSGDLQSSHTVVSALYKESFCSVLLSEIGDLL